MSYVNRKLKDIKANSIMYFDYGVYMYNAFFANCWKTCKKFSSMMSLFKRKHFDKYER